jgi:excisionase family DNA binding protein
MEEMMARLESLAGIRSDHLPIGLSAKTTLTDVEVAMRLGVSRFTLRAWRLKGRGPKFLKMGRAVRYRLEDVDEYERQALVETQAESGHAAL